MKQPDETKKKTAPDEPLPDAETDAVSGGLGGPDLPTDISPLSVPDDILPHLFVPKIDPPHFGPKLY